MIDYKRAWCVSLIRIRRWGWRFFHDLLKIEVWETIDRPSRTHQTHSGSWPHSVWCRRHSEECSIGVDATSSEKEAGVHMWHLLLRIKQRIIRCDWLPRNVYKISEAMTDSGTFLRAPVLYLMLGRLFEGEDHESGMLLSNRTTIADMFNRRVNRPTSLVWPISVIYMWMRVR